MDLVREFPLRPIRTKAEYAAAGRMLDRLVTRDENSLDRGEADYLEVLEDLIEVYDTKHTTLDRADDRPPLDRLKSLLAGAGVGVADFGRIIGSVSNASMILKGKRELSKEHIRKLAAHFRMDAGYFL
jgi:HTH-type transcriptional regulator/antitoxin HigA